MEVDTKERMWSKALFGNQNMLLVGGSIAASSVEFTAPELERVTGLSASSVHRLLSVLCAVGLLTRVPRGIGERTQRYRRRRHAFWRAMTQLRDHAQSAQGSATLMDGPVK